MHTATAAITLLILACRAVFRRSGFSKGDPKLPVPEVVESTWEEWHEQCATAHAVALHPAEA